MKNIIQLPKNKMKGTDGLQRAEARQIFLSLAVITAVMAAVMMNDSILKSSRPIYIVSDTTDPEKLSRFIASTGGSSTSMKDIEWEHKLARKLAQEQLGMRAPASISNFVSKIDQLRFGALAGKYSVLSSIDRANLVSKIEYVASNDVTDHPLFLDQEKFLEDNRGLLAVTFEKYEKAQSQDGKSVYRLLNAQSKEVGNVSFELDSEGRVISVNVAPVAQVR